MEKELQSKTPRRGFFKKLLVSVAGASILAPALFADEKPKTSSGIYPSPNSGYDPYLGEIALFAFNFAPNGWAQCNGQILSIASNTALFSLLGTTYGGNGSTTFALPDLRGRVVISQGTGPGLTNRVMGEVGGEENHVLTSAEMPAHTHTLAVSNLAGTSATPQSNVLARNSEGVMEYSTTSNTTMNSAAIGTAGSNAAHNNMQPYLVMNYCIATSGIFPTHP